MALDAANEALLADAHEQLIEREAEIARLRDDVDRFRTAYLDAERRLAELRRTRAVRIARLWWRLGSGRRRR